MTAAERNDQAADNPSQHLLLQRRRWLDKPVVAELYRRQIYARIAVARARAGPDVELGSGASFYKRYAPATFCSDLIPASWLDLACDAAELPFADGSIGNLIGVDLLHHMARPAGLFDQARRVLKPAGRLILVEPWMTPLGWLFYRLVHQETCRFAGEPFDRQHGPARGASLANPALPWLCLVGRARQFRRRWPGLAIRTIEPFCCWCWLLSGGLQPFSLLRAGWLPALLRAEERTRRLWSRWLSLRALIVIERCQ